MRDSVLDVGLRTVGEAPPLTQSAPFLLRRPAGSASRDHGIADPSAVPLRRNDPPMQFRDITLEGPVRLAGA